VVGIEAIVLTAGGADHHGRYRTYSREKTGAIEIPAWEEDLWRWHTRPFFEHHRSFFERIELAFDDADDDEVECRYTKAQAKAYLLLHVFLHELGHHVDRMQSKQQTAGRRGEELAERYANELLEVLWPSYLRMFGDPRRARGR
jgi:hypothetical protein